jgi:plastocyanin
MTSKVLLTVLAVCMLVSAALAQTTTANEQISTKARVNIPEISIISPKEGANLLAGNITVTVDVKNFNLSNNLGKANVPGQGHIHYYIDVPVPRIQGKPAMTSVGTFAPTINTSYMWHDVKAGRHNLSVQLANNDHTPVIPLAFAQVNITVRENAEPMDSETKTTGATRTAVAEQSKPSTTENNASMSSANGGKMDIIDLIARNMAFDKKVITVSAGSEVTVNFDNQDSGIPHNLAVCQDKSATNIIFKGEVITGSKKTTYKFTAPTKPGTYYFQCDIHPSMNGQFVVT